MLMLGRTGARVSSGLEGRAHWRVLGRDTALVMGQAERGEEVRTSGETEEVVSR